MFESQLSFVFSFLFNSLANQNIVFAFLQTSRYECDESEILMVACFWLYIRNILCLYWHLELFMPHSIIKQGDCRMQ